jgi:hypothetical protein
MRRARCASFFSTRLRNRDPAKASKQPGDCSLGTRAVVTRSRSRRNALLPAPPIRCEEKNNEIRLFRILRKGKFEGMGEAEQNQCVFHTSLTPGSLDGIWGMADGVALGP